MKTKLSFLFLSFMFFLSEDYEVYPADIGDLVF